MRRFALLLGIGTVLAVGGCKVTLVGRASYETCMVDSDCASTADTCVQVVTTTGARGRMCTRSCSRDADCPGSAVCDTISSGMCFQACLSSSNCAVGWSCVAAGPGGTNICEPGGSVGQATYASCSVDGDCGSAPDTCVLVTTTTGAAGRMCSRTCSRDADCPGAGLCETTTGMCFQGCVSSSDCRAGWSCVAAGPGGTNICEPAGGSTGVNTYGVCSTLGTPGDCSTAGDSCIGIQGQDGTRSSVCTHSCTTDANCVGGRCLSFDSGATFQCFEGCISSAGCAAGWSCTDTVGGARIPPVCLPGSATPLSIPPYYECTIGVPGQCGGAPDGCFAISVDGATRGMCTRSCATDADCPLDVMAGAAGSCMSFDSGVSFTCFHACLTSGDCPTGFACKSSTAGGLSFPPICLPM